MKIELRKMIITKAEALNNWLKKGGNTAREIVGFVICGLDGDSYHPKLKECKARKTKGDIIYTLGGKMGVAFAYNKGALNFKDLPEDYF